MNEISKFEYSKSATLIESNQASRPDKSLESYSDRLTTAEVMVQTLTKILMKQGLTKDELQSEIINTLEIREKNSSVRMDYFCPKCTRKMQYVVANPFLAKCLYCETEIHVFPYDKYDEEVAAPQQEPEATTTNQEYDVANDLNFDDIL